MVYHAKLSRATPEIIRLYRRTHEQIGRISPGKLIDAERQLMEYRKSLHLE